MIALELVTAANAMLFKEVRLRALLDTPSAFSSTYAEESQLTDAVWNARATERSGETSTTYLAMDGDIPCGIAAGFLDKEKQNPCAFGIHVGSAGASPAWRRPDAG